MTFATCLRKYRGFAGLSMKGLADEVGVTDGYISQLENAQKPAPSEDVCYKIINTLYQSLANNFTYFDILLEFNKEIIYDRHSRDYLNFSFKYIYWRMVNFSRSYGRGATDFLFYDLLKTLSFKQDVKKELLKELKITFRQFCMLEANDCFKAFIYLRRIFDRLGVDQKRIFVSRYLLGIEYAFDMDHLWIHPIEDPHVIKNRRKGLTKKQITIFEEFAGCLGV